MKIHIIKSFFFQEEFEDTKGVIRIGKSMKNRQHNGQKKEDKKDKQPSTKQWSILSSKKKMSIYSEKKLKPEDI